MSDLSLQAGDRVFLAWADLSSSDIHSAVMPAEVVGVFDGITLMRMESGTVRAPYGFEKVCRTEAEGWAVNAQRLTGVLARVQQHLDDAVQKAARGAVETVPA